jgi:glycine/D-amino acid oxidase-like deaminating enzyme
MYQHQHPVAIIGAGPVGLAAAAHLAARRIPFLIFERAPEPAASVRDWGHVRLFSLWRYNVDRVAREALEATGTWTPPPQAALPTGAELFAHYLEPLAALPAIRERLRPGHTVQAVARQHFDKVRAIDRAASPFVIRLQRAGARRRARVRGVLPGASCAGQRGRLKPSAVIRLVKKHIHVLFHLAAPKTRSSACSIDQALACLIDAGTSLCRTQVGEKRCSSPAC